VKLLVQEFPRFWEIYSFYMAAPTARWFRSVAARASSRNSS
jgi:hypothetical protein